MYTVVLCILLNNCALLWILRHFFDRYVEMETQKHSLQSQLSILKLKITTVEDLVTDTNSNLQKTFALLKRIQYKLCSGDPNSRSIGHLDMPNSPIPSKSTCHFDMPYSPLPLKSMGHLDIPFSPLPLKYMGSFDMPSVSEKKVPSSPLPSKFLYSLESEKRIPSL